MKQIHKIASMMLVSMMVLALSLVGAHAVKAADRDNDQSQSMNRDQDMNVGNQYLITFSHRAESCQQAQDDFRNALMSQPSGKAGKATKSRSSDETGAYGRSDQDRGYSSDVPEHAMMSNWRFGCSPDNRVSYLIVTANSEKDAKDMVPKSMQKDLKVIKLQEFGTQTGTESGTQSGSQSGSDQY